MEEQSQHWDEALYNELNLYFKSRIRELLEANPALLQRQQENKLQLADLVACMPLEDQNRWHRFLHLDQLKLNQDLQNHLEGKGEPFNPGTRFGNPFGTFSRQDLDDDLPKETW
ncbi:hypothetical protein GU926_03140 [Nibribacter ruber]|uniref:Uncharacterized protein n=1 Tax=Nibribacter ruber TaxID=2698458 RepID=A0A6P1NW68_9BACT|nr:hypothetical protein [Nibribacter ruber]QHL86489.1 hypothetical protein GU926_03140 [Nibribacter ruber]